MNTAAYEVEKDLALYYVISCDKFDPPLCRNRQYPDRRHQVVGYLFRADSVFTISILHMSFRARHISRFPDASIGASSIQRHVFDSSWLALDGNYCNDRQTVRSVY